MSHNTSSSPAGRWSLLRRASSVTAVIAAALLFGAPIASADVPGTTPAAGAAATPAAAPGAVATPAAAPGAVAPAAPGAGTTPAATPGTNASSGDYSQEEVAAITQSGIVYIDILWQGYVQFPTSTGLKWSKAVQAEYSCSGFVVSATGYVVTAGHCADPVEGRQGLIEQFLAGEVQNGDVTQAQAQSLTSEAIQNWKVEGDNNGSAVIRTVQVQQAGAASGVQVAKALTANVVDNRPLDQGDVTLLKVEAPAPMPALEIAYSVPDVGSNIAAMGFPGTVSGAVDSSMEPSYKTGRVSANQTENGNPFTQVDAAFSKGMSGGPVVNMQGQVIGVVSYSPLGETQSFNFAAGQETVSALLTRNGVSSALSPADQAFRDGLALYYNGSFREASAKFDVVLSTEPSNALAQKYKSKATVGAVNEPTTSAPAASGAVNPAGAGASAPAVGAGVPAIADASSSSSTGLPIWVWILLALVVVGLAAAVYLRTRRPSPAMAGGSFGPASQPAPYRAFGGRAPAVDPNATQVVTSTATSGYYAPNSGHSLAATRQCTQCGSANAGTARFCENCGAPTGVVAGQPFYPAR